MNDQLALQNVLAWTLQIVVIVPAAALLPRLLRMHSPVVRHAYWRVLLGVCLCLPVVQPWHPLAPVPVETPMAATAPAVPGAAAVVTTASPKAPVPPPRLNWRGSILPMIALVALARIGWLAAGVWRLRRIRASAKDGLPSDAEELEGLDVGRAQICYVRGICQPVTFGLRRPAICLPESLRAKPVAMRRVVIAHELWHVRRNDWPWLAAEEVLRSLFWFHPAIVWLVSRIQQTREEVVDELTVLQTRAKRAYVEALLAFADEPAPLAAAPFARRRHLVHRIGLLSREAVMSSKRVVAFVVAVLAVVALASVYATTRFPLTAATDVGQTAAPQVPPRDPRPATASRPGDREAALRTAIASQPDLPNNYIELAGLQEERGAYPEAEATLAAARSAVPNNTVLLRAIAGYYNRQGDFAKTMEALEAVADIDPTDPVRHQIVATYYWEKAYKDQRLPASVKQEYIDKGIAATDRALAA
ncbi:MAG TPA: M56 family metallopeptidase, partial [Vicinamibacterales bacterium]